MFTHIDNLISILKKKKKQKNNKLEIRELLKKLNFQ